MVGVRAAADGDLAAFRRLKWREHGWDVREE
jgi:hypothetical protein